jgi:hypothetical protein
MPTNINETTMQKVEENGHELDRRLMEEINLLKLEGALFCFDPREAKKRGSALALTDARKQPVSLSIDAVYGQPSVLAYKVLQAVFLKLTEQGCELNEDGRCIYNDSVSFSQRELMRLVGRTIGGRQSQQVYNAVMQLYRTGIVASLYEKESDEWAEVNFQVFITTYFSGRSKTISRCSVQLHPKIVESINRRHIALFNLNRLNKLDTLGLVLYKRVFFHLSNLMQEKKAHSALRFMKDYETICREWLGGLKPLRFKSKILQDQLGRHLDDLEATGLIRRYSLEKNKGGNGFNLTFYPGKGFFDDYQAYYIDTKQPRMRFRASAELAEVKALELVAHFHRQLGRTTQTKFQDSETAYADELLTTYSDAEIRDLISYAVSEAATTKFDMLFFGALRQFVPKWAKDQARRKERQLQLSAIKDCSFCDERGYLELKREGSNELTMSLCPHKAELITQIEDRSRAFRV